jgi:hypothetical protein
MIRRLFTLLSAASLLLCAATCVLWVRTYYVQDDGKRTTVELSPGGCTVVEVGWGSGDGVLMLWREVRNLQFSEDSLEHEAVQLQASREAWKLEWNATRGLDPLESRMKAPPHGSGIYGSGRKSTAIAMAW